MSDTGNDWRMQTPADGFSEVFEGMNEAFASTLERNVEAQAAAVEAMTETFLGTVPDEDELADGLEGYASASEIWLEAADRTFEETTAAMEEEDLDPETFRDIWLRATNDALAELASTDAFAAANGELVGAMLGRQQDIEEMQQESLAQAGFATTEDVSEVAERLIELERRQHDVEQKLDRILEAVE
jgi:sulfite reductase beta subunit-like hemoprotein